MKGPTQAFDLVLWFLPSSKVQLLYLFIGCSTRLAGSQFPNQGPNQGPGVGAVSANPWAAKGALQLLGLLFALLIQLNHMLPWS